jgi:hypothetical protein
MEDNGQGGGCLSTSSIILLIMAFVFTFVYLMSADPSPIQALF